MSQLDLVADIGGTHARFALSRNGALHDISIVKHRELPTFTDALGKYLQDQNGAKPTRCCLALATPITGDNVALTNSHWTLSRPDLISQFGFDQVAFINDFTALAHALPTLTDEDLAQIGGTTSDPTGPRALLGAGTGLGVSALLNAAGTSIALAGEGGHVAVPQGSERDIHVVTRLQSQFGRVSLERILSGQGLRNVHWALDASGTEDLDQQPDAADISAAAQRTDSLRALETLKIFTRMLGGYAGDLALILGATGGVYIGGGIATALADDLANWGLRDAFEDKGRMQRVVHPIPIYIIKHPHPGLVGAATYLQPAHQGDS